MDKNSIIIRRADKTDLEVIQQFGFELLDFERRNWDATLDPKWPFSEVGKKKYLEAIQEKYTSIAELNDKPIGFLVGKIIEPPADSARHIKLARVENIFVTEEMRKNGVGLLLIADFKKYCQQMKASRLDVSVLANNKDAVNFYEKMGFEPRSTNLMMKLD